MATLVRKVKGLPRFMLDCGWWRSRKWTGVGLAAIGLQSCAISYCYEHGTDGRLPKEDLALGLGLRDKEVRAAVQVLLKKGRWIEVDDEYEIVGYHDHNPSQAEVEEYRSVKSTAGLAGNHEKWHVGRGVTSSSCPLCASHVRPPPDRTCEAKVSHPASQVDKAEQSKQSRVSRSGNEDSSSSNHQRVGLRAATDDDESSPPKRALALIAERRIAAAEASGAVIKNPGGYRRRVLERVDVEFGDQATDMLLDGMTPEAVADALVPLMSDQAKRYPAFEHDAGPVWEVDEDGNARKRVSA